MRRVILWVIQPCPHNPLSIVFPLFFSRITFRIFQFVCRYAACNARGFHVAFPCTAMLFKFGCGEVCYAVRWCNVVWCGL